MTYISLLKLFNYASVDNIVATTSFVAIIDNFYKVNLAREH